MPEHLAQGSTEPPFSPGKLRLYGMRFCPFDHRIHLVLIAKQIPHDYVFINLGNKPDWYLKIIPSGKVPGLVVDGQPLHESLIIADFLDEKYPQRPLHSKDPLQKAKDRILLEGFGKMHTLFYRLVTSGSSPPDDLLESLYAELASLDKELAERKTNFFTGLEPGMVDYMIWPWIERLGAGKILSGNKFDFPEKLQHLSAWINLMMEDKTVKEYALKPEIYGNYLKTYASGAPNYNMPI